MKKRVCVMAIPSGTKGALNPKPLLVYRGHPLNASQLVEACLSRLPEDLAQPEGRGQIFIGLEDESRIKNLTRSSPGAIEWMGTKKSGPFELFLIPHVESYLSTNSAKSA